jgi:hypothetical protein
LIVVPASLTLSARFAERRARVAAKATPADAPK